MSAKTYTFIFPDGDFLQQSFRCTQDAIDYAKEELDGVGCVSISREITEHHDIGTVENGVFTADAQESDPLRDAAPDLLDAASDALAMIRYIIDDGYSYEGGADIASKMASAIAKAKGGAL